MSIKDLVPKFGKGRDSTPARRWEERGLSDFQRDMNRLFGPLSDRGQHQGNYPAVNIWTGEENAVLTAELPGVDPDGLDITVKNNTVTIRGERKPEELKEGESYMRQERGAGQFVRSFSLPVRGAGVLD